MADMAVIVSAVPCMTEDFQTLNPAPGTSSRNPSPRIVVPGLERRGEQLSRRLRRGARAGDVGTITLLYLPAMARLVAGFRRAKYDQFL
jgi:hypothetical protein